MKKEYLKETKMLNFKSQRIQSLIQERKWNQLDDYHKIEKVYDYVQNEIELGFNRKDTLVATQMIEDGYGQCNTKATLLMALLRGVNIPCRLHGFKVSKDFQLGVTPKIISLFVPKEIIHTWVDVYYLGSWKALEGVITDQRYFNAVKLKTTLYTKPFKYYAIAVEDL